MKKTSKSGTISTIVVTIVFLGLLNVISFVVPFQKNNLAIFYTVYAVTELLILLQGLLVLLTIFKEENRSQRVLGLPIIYSGYITLILQVVVLVIFFILNALINLELWILIVVETLIVAYFTYSLSIGFFFKVRNIEYQKNTGNTSFIDELRARLKAFVNTNKNENIHYLLENLYDIAKGSDSISNERTFDTEEELLSLLQQLNDSIKEGLTEETIKILEVMTNILLERNALSKLGK